MFGVLKVRYQKSSKKIEVLEKKIKELEKDLAMAKEKSKLQTDLSFSKETPSQKRLLDEMEEVKTRLSSATNVLMIMGGEIEAMKRREKELFRSLSGFISESKSEGKLLREFLNLVEDLLKFKRE